MNYICHYVLKHERSTKITQLLFRNIYSKQRALLVLIL